MPAIIPVQVGLPISCFAHLIIRQGQILPVVAGPGPVTPPPPVVGIVLETLIGTMLVS